VYYEHFGFKAPPFSISPDPHFLYLSDRHRDALAHLVYGIGENGGFVLLTGPVGTGKTTLIRTLLSKKIDNVDIALCLHAGLDVMDFIAAILDEFHIYYPKENLSLKTLIDSLNRYLLASHARGRQTVLIIDEAQNLSRKVLEQLRLLTNLETDQQKLLRIILVGQEELQTIIDRQDLRQFSQRITCRYQLAPLTVSEVAAYINYRVQTAKGSPTVFSASAIRQIYQKTKGIPRLINVLCDRSLLAAYSQDDYQVKPWHVKLAAQETVPQSRFLQKSPNPKQFRLFSFCFLLIAAIFGGYYWFRQQPPAGISSPIVASLISDDKTPDLSLATITADKELLPKNSALSAAAVSRETAAQASGSSDQTSIESDKTLDMIEAMQQKFTETSRALNIAQRTQQPIENNKTLNPAEAEAVQQKPLLINSIPVKSIEHYAEQEHDGILSLLKIWDISVPETQESACQLAKKYQLVCMRGTGGFPLIRSINRPVLLELDKQGNDSKWLLVTKITEDDGTMTCLDDATPVQCSLGEVSNHWTGNYLLLLRQPNVYIVIKPGFDGKQVNWLRQRIAIADGQNLNDISQSSLYDSELVDQVKAFQLSYHIESDGIIGRKTLTYLYNVVADSNTPMLVKGAYQ